MSLLRLCLETKDIAFGRFRVAKRVLDIGSVERTRFDKRPCKLRKRRLVQSSGTLMPWR